MRPWRKDAWFALRRAFLARSTAGGSGTVPPSSPAVVPGPGVVPSAPQDRDTCELCTDGSCVLCRAMPEGEMA